MSAHDMKNIIATLSATALLAACGGAPEGDLAKKRLELDSLKEAYKATAEKIKEVDAWITEHDTTVKKNLPVVKSFELKTGSFDHYVDVHGNVKADRAAALYAMSGGRVRAIHRSPGDQVRQGDLIISLDNNMVREQIEQARTGYELAKTVFEKQETLWKQQIGSEIQYLQAKSQMEQAEAGLKTLQEQQRLTDVTAPFDGTIDDIMVRVGDAASPMAPVARVVDLTGAQLEADVPEAYLNRIKRDAQARVDFPSLDTALNAHVEHVGNFIDPANRTFKVTVHVPNGGAYIKPNLLSDISILDSRTDSALVVPTNTILEDVDGNSYLFALDKSGADQAKARKVMVQRLGEYKGSTQVREKEAGSLTSGTLIVLDGARNVSNGQTVRIANN